MYELPIEIGIEDSMTPTPLTEAKCLSSCCRFKRDFNLCRSFQVTVWVATKPPPQLTQMDRTP
eukprot:scaffold38973_cov16-Prasinocladus_malaysianus.AAC.1